MASPYELIYWGGIPGRGEHVRLILEEAGAEYTDTASLSPDKWYPILTETLKGDEGNAPLFAPPVLRHGDLLISQTSNILMYLASRHGLQGSKAADSWRVNAMALTALDGLSNEVHDCHHPIVNELYWEDQKVESARKSKEWLKHRLPKHLGYWQRVLEHGGGQWLLGSQFSYADLVLYQCLDGTTFAFPKAMKQARDSGRFDRVFQLYEDVRSRPKIAAYLASERRQKYGDGIYRYYPENDFGVDAWGKDA